MNLELVNKAMKLTIAFGTRSLSPNRSAFKEELWQLLFPTSRPGRST
jgi:hypothetical protein